MCNIKLFLLNNNQIPAKYFKTRSKLSKQNFGEQSFDQSLTTVHNKKYLMTA